MRPIDGARAACVRGEAVHGAGMTPPRQWLRTVCATLLALTSMMPLFADIPPADMKIFLLIGQSNMAGRGKVEEQDRTPHARVFMLNKEMAWVPAVDPVHFDKPERIGTGLTKTFGIVVAEADP